MKQAIFLLCSLLLLHPYCHAQKVVLSTDQARILYAYLENKVSIAVPGYPCNDLQLTAGDCTVTGSGCSYTITPKTEQTVTFIISSKKTRRFLDTIAVSVRPIPDPVLKIASGKNNTGKIFKEGPVITSDDCSYIEAFYQIAGFEVTIINKDTITHHIKTTGSRFEPATVQAIENAKPGDKLFLEEIRVTGPDNKKRLLNSVTYRFK